MFHFGMTGGVVVKDVGTVQYRNLTVNDQDWPPKFWKVQLEFDGNGQGTVELAFFDARRFGRVRLQADPLLSAPVKDLGFDPILSMPTLDDFKKLLEKERRGLKALLLDQSFSAGVGNWVADEVLYQARLHPEEKSNTLDLDQVEALHSKLHTVLRTAVDADADSSKFPADWLFHHRWTGKKAGPKLDGHPVEFETVAGRTTAYVPAVQKLRKSSAGGAKPKKKAGGKAIADDEEGGTEALAEEKVAGKKPVKKKTAEKGSLSGQGKTSKKKRTVTSLRPSAEEEEVKDTVHAGGEGRPSKMQKKVVDKKPPTGSKGKPELKQRPEEPALPPVASPQKRKSAHTTQANKKVKTRAATDLEETAPENGPTIMAGEKIPQHEEEPSSENLPKDVATGTSSAPVKRRPRGKGHEGGPSLPADRATAPAKKTREKGKQSKDGARDARPEGKAEVAATARDDSVLPSVPKVVAPLGKAEGKGKQSKKDAPEANQGKTAQDMAAGLAPTDGGTPAFAGVLPPKGTRKGKQGRKDAPEANTEAAAHDQVREGADIAGVDGGLPPPVPNTTAAARKSKGKQSKKDFPGARGRRDGTG
eukprot:jgi/Botrbrau1/23136/Bobra.0243s0064.2